MAPLPTVATPQRLGLPKPGEIQNGYIFQGGDPKAQASWKPASGDAFLSSLPIPDTQKALIRGIATYDYAPGGNRSLGSPEAQQVLGLVKMYDPTFDAKVYKQRGDLLHEVTQGDTSKQLKNLTNVSLHARDLMDSYDQMNLSSSPLVNGAENWMAANTPFTADMHTRQGQLGRTTDAVNFLAPEAARLGVGGAPNEGDINAVREQFNTNTPPAVAAGGLGDIAHKAAQRLLGIQDQWKRAFGTLPPKQPFINKDAAVALHDLITRYKVDGGDKLDWNVLTSGGWTPDQARGMMGEHAQAQPPPGIDPKIWGHLTPQERALWH